ncbi:MAG: cytochrome c biogenesis protein CcsA, partial [Xanthomonadales bacterium]|nr:cytochrome c biogenesis protein CcsA [Xanthomonadales bacterium]
GLGALIEQEKKLSHIIFLGWLVLTTSLLSGVLFIDDFINQHIGHKVVFSFLAWLIFGILIAGRLTKGWRGEKLISLTILGMSLLAMGYLGSKIVIEWIL